MTIVIRKTSLVALALSLSHSGTHTAEAQEIPAEQEVRAAVSAFGEAFVEADVAALRDLLTEQYLHVNGLSGSVLNRSEWLEWMTSRQAALASGGLLIHEYTVTDLRVRLYGTTAVVTGRVDSRGVHSEAPFSSQVRFTNVWVNEQGSWRRAAFHDSPLSTD